jgi:hypothetical protein
MTTYKPVNIASGGTVLMEIRPPERETPPWLGCLFFLVFGLVCGGLYFLTLLVQ